MASLKDLYPIEYRAWKAMRARCRAPSYSKNSYQHKGIKVCERWNSFLNFYNDMGPRPPKHSLDRIDNNGDYSPENCRWATQMVQCRNRGSFNKVYTYNGETMCLKDWATKLGIKYITLQMRTKRHPNMPFDEIVKYCCERNERLEYKGKQYTRTELCETFGIPKKLFYDRWHKGWSLERIITTPKLKSKYDERNNFTNGKKKSTEL